MVTLGIVSMVGLVTAIQPGVVQAEDCGDFNTAILPCGGNNSGGLETNGIWGLLILVLNIMTAGVGIAAVGGIIYAAILYTSARDNSGQVSKAKVLIFNVVLGLIAYAGMFAFLQWIIPGGIFS